MPMAAQSQSLFPLVGLWDECSFGRLGKKNKASPATYVVFSCLTGNSRDAGMKKHPNSANEEEMSPKEPANRTASTEIKVAISLHVFHGSFIFFTCLFQKYSVLL